MILSTLLKTSYQNLVFNKFFCQFISAIYSLKFSIQIYKWKRKWRKSMHRSRNWLCSRQHSGLHPEIWINYSLKTGEIKIHPLPVALILAQLVLLTSRWSLLLLWFRQKPNNGSSIVRPFYLPCPTGSLLLIISSTMDLIMPEFICYNFQKLHNIQCSLFFFYYFSGWHPQQLYEYLCNRYTWLRV